MNFVLARLYCGYLYKSINYIYMFKILINHLLIEQCINIIFNKIQLNFSVLSFSRQCNKIVKVPLWIKDIRDDILKKTNHNKQAFLKLTEEEKDIVYYFSIYCFYVDGYYYIRYNNLEKLKNVVFFVCNYNICS